MLQRHLCFFSVLLSSCHWKLKPARPSRVALFRVLQIAANWTLKMSAQTWLNDFVCRFFFPSIPRAVKLLRATALAEIIRAVTALWRAAKFINNELPLFFSTVVWLIVYSSPVIDYFDTCCRLLLWPEQTKQLQGGEKTTKLFSIAQPHFNFRASFTLGKLCVQCCQTFWKLKKM